MPTPLDAPIPKVRIQGIPIQNRGIMMLDHPLDGMMRMAIPVGAVVIGLSVRIIVGIIGMMKMIGYRWPD
jgi:hypothetical protein